MSLRHNNLTGVNELTENGRGNRRMNGRISPSASSGGLGSDKDAIVIRKTEHFYEQKLGNGIVVRLRRPRHRGKYHFERNMKPLIDDDEHNYNELNFNSNNLHDDEDDDDCCQCCDSCCQGGSIQYPSGIWFVRDPCGITCAVFTWLLIGYALVAVNLVLLTSIDIIHRLFFNGMCLLAVASHIKAMLTDPGSNPRSTANRRWIDNEKFENIILWKCAPCNSIKVGRAHHCSTCHRCIRKMDHHCPWINNCVGETNQKYFILFTLYIFIISFYALFLLALYLWTCSSNNWINCSFIEPPASIVIIIFLTFESLLFGIFTGVMFCSQVSGIYTDETAIECLQNSKESIEENDGWFNLKQTFGRRFGISWFSPFHSPNIKRFPSVLDIV
ncbi:hypothetical protein SNEBB_008793 [Seison nebaliae]|nr:hypothetical protein SNEBB_008793 [Seison nebaliae]